MYFRIRLILFVLSSVCALYEDDLYVVTLTNYTFNDLVVNSRRIWIVQFYVNWCSECEKFPKQFSQTAQAFEGFVKFGAVNGDDNRKLVQEQNVSEYPTMIIFNGPNGLPQVYTEKTEVNALTSFLIITIHTLVNMKLDGVLNPAMFKTKLTEDLNETNFHDLVLKSKKMWLVVIYIRSSLECINLSREWNVVETEINGIIKMGSLDAIANYFTAGECKLLGYPTIKFFPRGRKKISFGITYVGRNNVHDIVEWVFSIVAETNPVPTIVQITNSVALEEACNQKRMCIVAFLPQADVCKDDCRNDYLDKLETLKLQFKKYFWGWGWSEGKAQYKLEDALKIKESYPCLAAINLRTNKYAVICDSFTMENVTKFLKYVTENNVKDYVKKGIEIISIDTSTKKSDYTLKEEL